MRQNSVSYTFSKDRTWVVLNDVERHIQNKLESIGTPLKSEDWEIAINYGIKTGCNDAFIISKEKYEELLNIDTNSSELIKPLLRGRDIKKYSFDFSDKYLITAYNGSYRVLEKSYPAIFDHLKSYEDELKNRGQAKYTSSGKQNLVASYPGQHHWLELDNNPSKEYMDDFSKQKIVYPNMTKYLPFYLDSEGFFTNDKGFIIIGRHLAYLTAFLNSSLFKYAFIDAFPELQGGTRELRKAFMELIPVKTISDNRNEVYQELVTKIQNFKAQGKDTENIEKQIDLLIFEEYGLSDKEKKIIGYIDIK